MTRTLTAFVKRLLAHDVLRFAALVAIAVFLLDWATKSWALDVIGHEVRPVGTLMIGVERNDALAFSTGAGRMHPAIVLAIRVAALAALIQLWLKVGTRSRRLAAGFALLFAGGIGNAADVLFRGGAVVDFIHAGPITFQLGDDLIQAGIVFNTADISILLALGLLAPLIHEWSLGGQRQLAEWESRWLRARTLRQMRQRRHKP